MVTIEAPILPPSHAVPAAPVDSWCPTTLSKSLELK
jgi:hypothetical protein